MGRISMSFLKMLYGYEQRLWVIEVMDTEEPPISDVQSWLQERRAMTDNLKLHLNRANQQMKTLLEICPRGNNKLVIIIFPCS